MPIPETFRLSQTQVASLLSTLMDGDTVGVRGYTWVSNSSNTVVIAYKGTSTHAPGTMIDQIDTTSNDKLQVPCRILSQLR